jgi:hypothetical protein
MHQYSRLTFGIDIPVSMRQHLQQLSHKRTSSEWRITNVTTAISPGIESPDVKRGPLILVLECVTWIQRQEGFVLDVLGKEDGW